MNKVFLIGRLTKDPTQQEKKDGKGSYAKFSIAVNRFPGNVDYFDCIAFDKTGEAIIKWTKKVSKIAISGRIQMGKYTATDGTTRVQAYIVCENVEFLISKTEEKNVEFLTEKDAEKAAEKPAEKPTEKPTDSDFVEMPF